MPDAFYGADPAVTFGELDPAARPLVGPEADHELLGLAMRWCGGVGPRGEPGARAFVGKAQAPEHLCELEAEAFEFCAKASPAGGLAACVICGCPIFVPPETCLERIREESELELVIDRATGERRIGHT